MPTVAPRSIPQTSAFCGRLLYVAALLVSACCLAAGNVDWKRYPYCPKGTEIEFPRDEGTHKSDSTVTMEWWYVNLHLEDPVTKAQYSVMVAFFKKILGHSLRLFDITSVAESKMYTGTADGALIDKAGKLDLTYTSPAGTDRLQVKSSPDGSLLPFHYQLDVHGAKMAVSFDLESTKPPLLVGGNGYVQVGNSGNSWYYSLTNLKATGTITLGTRRIDVVGVAWMDHQWGPFMVSPIPIIETDTYEWFSLHLDNGEEYMISNIFDCNDKLQRKKGFGGLGWVLADGSTGDTLDFTLRRLAFWRAPCGDQYSAKWQLIEPGRNLDLTITPVFADQTVPLPRTSFGQFYFWEGLCSVVGKIGGKQITGRAFAELTHRFEAPVVNFRLPRAGKPLSGKVAVAWIVDNPDEGNPLKSTVLCRRKGAESVVLTQNTDGTSCIWDTTRFPAGDAYVLEVVTSSCDGTISGSKRSAPFTICSNGEVISKPQIAPQPVAEERPLSYPYLEGQLTFPEDEGVHLPTEHPYTVMEWFANYTHFSTEAGTRYFLFSTFVTYDPIEEYLGGRFPHMIATLVDVTHGKTYHCRDKRKLAKFEAGHADAETQQGDYFRWKGRDKPFEYEYQVTVRDEQGEYSIDLDLKMVKPPLVVNGTGYIREPEGLSGYYSQTRLKASGHLTIGGTKKAVSGIHWVDRQWLGASFSRNDHYSYEWWALQLDNNEEAIMFRIWDTNDDTIAMTVLEINHADGKREKVADFSLTNLSAGWHLVAPEPSWDLRIVPACTGQGAWQSCNVTGMIQGDAVTGLAVAELMRDLGKELGSLFSADPKNSAQE